MASSVIWIRCAALFLLSIGAAHSESERCVAAADGSWNCGKDVTDADAAPLPERQSRSLPPVFLIDPARFGEGDASMDEAPEMPSTPAVEVTEATESSSNTSDAAVSAPEASAAANGTSSMASTEPKQSIGGKFVVQLAVASTPRGFDALLAKLGTAARNSQRRQLTNGTWVLLIGNYNSIAEARVGIPGSVPGAFARDISTLNFR